MNTPEEGESYRHVKSGRLYTIKCIAIDEHSPTRRLVIYKAFDGTIWARELVEFCDGRFVKVND